MGHPVGKKEESRAKILASAGRGFRAHGFGGLGVDGLAKAAGVTSGAFYAHFTSKNEVFQEAVRSGMHSLVESLKHFKGEGGDWVARYVDFYLGPRCEAPLSDSCALQSLTGEVARADPATRDIYGAELEQVIASLATGMDADDPDQQRAMATALLALLSGGVSMVRAVNDPVLARQIVAALRSHAMTFRRKS